MKKKFLIGIMVVTLSALTMGCTITKNETKSNTIDGVMTITKGGEYTLTGTSDNCQIVIDTDDDVTLILNGVDYTSTSGPVIYGAQVGHLYIELAEGTVNTLTDSATYETDDEGNETAGDGVIACEDDITITGEGTLNITANYKHAIASDDSLTVESGTINVTSAVKDGIHVNDLITIEGGTINITCDDEGVESKADLVINGGTITVNAKDDGLNAGNSIEINDGDITVTATNGDAVDCNGGVDGCITINGGTLVLTGADLPEGALDADTSSVIINGGKVTATGGTNSPIIENGGENNITGSTFTEGGMRGNGQEGFEKGERPQMPEMPEMSEGQTPPEMPEKDLKN